MELGPETFELPADEVGALRFVPAKFMTEAASRQFSSNSLRWPYTRTTLLRGEDKDAYNVNSDSEEPKKKKTTMMMMMKQQQGFDGPSFLNTGQ